METKDLTKEDAFKQRFQELMIEGVSIKIDDKKYPNSTFGFKNDIFLWEYNSKKGYLWISYTQIWSKLEGEFSLNYQELKELIKITVEEHFNCKGIIPNNYIF